MRRRRRYHSAGRIHVSLDWVGTQATGLPFYRHSQHSHLHRASPIRVVHQRAGTPHGAELLIVQTVLVFAHGRRAPTVERVASVRHSVGRMNIRSRRHMALERIIRWRCGVDARLESRSTGTFWAQVPAIVRGVLHWSMRSAALSLGGGRPVFLGSPTEQEKDGYCQEHQGDGSNHDASYGSPTERVVAI